jgi:hypothetical protein
MRTGQQESQPLASSVLNIQNGPVLSATPLKPAAAAHPTPSAQ